ncbi:helix-turn-helix domain-containing protein [Bacillus sp. UNC438CL73TsuS30]|uniref:helix-turn-helix domain-containing protein n=1 Tax=Bacillus sp. UNC438CL73TsuS30 TaxID=1340434 RepID=UPI00047E7DB1|nr:helix-turn-helix domain-containing protein [Bacillus sp. UNC438CL73TsuS30]
MRLLIADRDSTERNGIEWLVKSYSMRISDIHQSSDMVSLLKELEEFKPDLLLVELEMIPSTGWEIFLHKIEKFDGAIIAITTEAVFERAWQAIQIQSSGLLLKPLSPERVRLVISKVINNKKNKKISELDIWTDKEILPRYYNSLFFEVGDFRANLIGILVLQPEDKSEIRELSEWLQDSISSHHRYVLPLRDHIVCLLPDYTGEMVYDEGKRIFREAIRRNSSKLFIVVSSINFSSITIHASYEKALQSLKTIFFVGYQQIVKVKNTPVYLDIDPFLTSNEQREWMEMLEKGDKLGIKRWLYGKFTEFPDGYPDPELLRIRLTSILAQLRRFMKTYQLEKKHQMEIHYQQIFQTILHEPVLFRIVQELLLFTYDIFQQVQNQRGNASGDFIERGLRFIDENYCRSDLSLEEVANFVQRSPSYFSHILSERRQQTFRQYLAEVRIKKAKNLLSTTSLTVREIAFAIGYDDPNYFSRLFKENTGCSPRLWKTKK